MKTIAIIDDDIHIGNMLEEVLIKEGYGVLRAYSGTEALMLLSNKTPDLVLYKSLFTESYDTIITDIEPASLAIVQKTIDWNWRTYEK